VGQGRRWCFRIGELHRANFWPCVKLITLTLKSRQSLGEIRESVVEIFSVCHKLLFVDPEVAASSLFEERCRLSRQAKESLCSVGYTRDLASHIDSGAA
jgi:hypothetical protein